jgi:hypothetical protein
VVDDVEWGKVSIPPPEHSLTILPAEPPTIKSGASGRRKWWAMLTTLTNGHELSATSLALSNSWPEIIKAYQN